ncbi:primase-helicase family protein [Mesonia ostreae]|uniref:DUF5906 domain-containing protein n=1 Tax=Mesonia ostreae TaxID=861110 RepID=A0ABU2KKC1_9FLAO|nr:DUF5906 domain-containing protein [Mesonia ostreae]MDT0295181.1 DUF5906 domain-containing protein [Mesonia ostreae]
MEENANSNPKNNTQSEESEALDYFRIATSYFKNIKKPLISGDTLDMLAPWSKDCIRDDRGKPFLDKIKKYDGFCCVPSHIKFQQEISNFYNTYKELPFKPGTGEITNTINFLEHIFGSQLSIGLDYLKILYEIPTQILPVFCLVSKERNTGKTTFLNWLKNIFGPNMTYNTNDDFRSQFNSDWSSKLLIAVDEVLLDKIEDTERIKNLSTARTYKVEAKGKDKNEIEFFGKFVLCSNNERTFIRIEAGEIRFWVRKIVPFKTEDKNLLDKLILEIPAFLSFLLKREFSTPSATRMWFTPQQLQTDALKRLKSYNKNALEIELVNSIIEIIENFELDEFQFCFKDLQNLMSKSPFNPSKTRLKNIIKDEWNLTPAKNSLSYKKFTVLSDGTIIESSDRGRYYSLKKSYLLENYDELMQDTNN